MGTGTGNEVDTQVEDEDNGEIECLSGSNHENEAPANMGND